MKKFTTTIIHSISETTNNCRGNVTDESEPKSQAVYTSCFWSGASLGDLHNQKTHFQTKITYFSDIQIRELFWHIIKIQNHLDELPVYHKYSNHKMITPVWFFSSQNVR